MARNKILHITDLETVKSLDASKIGEQAFLSTSLFNNVTRLSITLRLPHPLCHALERVYDSRMSAPEVACDIQIWLQLGATLTQLKKLRKLRIWLDHDEACSWSVVNERALLSSLTPLCTIEGLDVSISLPKLHPMHEADDRHFVKGSYTRFRLIRRLRQCHHGGKPGGPPEVIIKHDFPVSLELKDIISEWDDGPMPTLAEVEEEERQQWMSGTDVEALVIRSMDSGQVSQL